MVSLTYVSVSMFLMQAFMCLSDVLVAHSCQLQMWDSSVGAPLLYTPDPRLQKALLNFILEHAFASPEPHSHSSTGSPALHLSFFCSHYLTICLCETVMIYTQIINVRNSYCCVSSRWHSASMLHEKDLEYVRVLTHIHSHSHTVKDNRLLY